MTVEHIDANIQRLIETELSTLKPERILEDWKTRRFDELRADASLFHLMWRRRFVEERADLWEEDFTYTLSDWQYIVARKGTRLSYLDWVAQQKTYDKEMQDAIAKSRTESTKEDE